MSDLKVKKETNDGRVVLSEHYEVYEPKSGEYWYSIVSSKYGADSEEAKEIVKDLKEFNGINTFSLIIQPDMMKLPKKITLGDKEFQLDFDKKVDIRSFRLNFS